VNDGRVTSPGSFDYTTSLPGTYTLVWDNIFSVITSKSVSVTYTVSGSTHSQSFTVQPGHNYELSFNLGNGDRVYGNFAVSGGSNDVNFYITAQTCTETVSFSFTLVNPGSANGFATARLLEDGKDTTWSNRYYVPQGGQVQGSGTITFRLRVAYPKREHFDSRKSVEATRRTRAMPGKCALALLFYARYCSPVNVDRKAACIIC